MSANTPIWKGPTNALVIQPNSPSLEYGDRVRCTDIYKGPQNLCAISMLARGTYGTGFRTGWVVNKSSVQTGPGRVGTLTVEWEAGGSYANQPLPVGDYMLEPQEMYPRIERAGVFQYPTPITFATLNVCRNCVDLATTSTGTPIVTATWLTDHITDATQLALAQNLVSKWIRGAETFYLTAWKYTFTYFSYTVPTLNKGGIIVTPGGPLAGSLPSGLSWLRLADRLEPAGVNGSMNKITCSFLGGPTLGGVGYWDTDVYV